MYAKNILFENIGSRVYTTIRHPISNFYFKYNIYNTYYMSQCDMAKYFTIRLINVNKPEASENKAWKGYTLPYHSDECI